MATPYSTPLIPSAPRATPSSMYQSTKALKPPIHNPYDKFTQPEFDSWIGDITGALRRALGQEPVQATHEDLGDYLDGDAQDSEGDEGSEGDSEDDQGFEDSFAEVKVRYAKGKARDPREGPGLGSRHQPIDIGSGSEGEDSGEESSGDEREYSEREDEAFDDGITSSPIQNGQGTNHEEPIELTSDEEGSAVDGGDVADADEEYFQGSQDIRGDEWGGVSEGEDHEADVTSEVIEGYRRNNAPSDYAQHETVFDENETFERQEDYSGIGGNFIAEDVDDFPTSRDKSPPHPPDLLDPWQGPMTYAEDFYSGGDFRESDLNFRKPSPSNLTPLRNELGGSFPSAKYDDEDENELFDLRHPLSSSPMEQVVTEDLYTDMESGAPLMDSEVVEGETGPGSPVFGATEDGHPLITYDSASKHSALGLSPSPSQIDNIASTEHPRVMEGHGQAEASDALGIAGFNTGNEETRVIHDNEGEINKEIAGNETVDMSGDGATHSDSPNIDTSQQEGVTWGHAVAHSQVTEGEEFEIQPLTASGANMQDQYARINSLSDGVGPDSLSDFGVLPDPSPELGSVPLAGQEDMSEILSFLVRDKEDHLDVNEPMDDGERPPDGLIYTMEKPEMDGGVDELFDGEEFDVVSIGGDVAADKGIDTGEESVLEMKLTEEPDDIQHGPNITTAEYSEEAVSPQLAPEVLSARATPTLHSSAEDAAGRDMASEHGDVVIQSEVHSPQAPEKEVLPDHPKWSPGRETTRELYHGVPMPVSADPNVPDPTIQSSLPSNSPGRAPMILSLPGTPAFLLSPAGTPGMPTPVAIPVPTAVLKAMQMRQSLSAVTTSGLFTPANGSESAPASPSNQHQLDDTEIPDVENSNSGIELSTDSPSVPSTVVEPQIDMEIADRLADHSSRPGDDEAPENGITLCSEVQPEMPVASKQSDHSELSLSEGLPGILPDIVIPSIFPIVHRPDPTTPTLCSDPYPYSLSTPGLEFVISDEGQDDYRLDSPEEENENSTTSSSSTIKKDMGLPDYSPANFRDEDLEDFELLYPSETESKDDIAASTSPDTRYAGEDSNILNEPDVGGANSNENSDLDLGVSQGHDTDTKQDSADPFKLAAHDGTSQVSGDLETGNPVLDELEGKPKDIHHPHSDNGIHRKLDSSMQEAGALEEQNQALGDRPVGGAVVKSPSRHPNGTTSKGLGKTPLKRRRKALYNKRILAPPTTPTHGRSTRIRVKGKGKEKASDHEGGDDIEPARAGSNRDGSSTSSGASAALRILRPGSATTSRASSVLSNAPSGASSPDRQPRGHDDNIIHPPQALFHTHGAIRHHHQPPPSQVTQQLHQKQAIAAVPPAPPRVKASLASSSRSEQSVSQRSPASSGSPVTRSNCRFHKISLPREEGGPRVYFLVPGCSLGDRQLMEYQEIEDHGFATLEEGSRMIPDIESLDFNLYLVGILRQLVGVDLLREQEVYYLPQPGEDYSRKLRHKSALTRLSFRDTAAFPDSNNSVGSPRVASRSRHSSFSQAPLSADSTSTSARKNLASESSLSTASYSDNEMDVRDFGTPRAKRRRKSRSNNTTGSEIAPRSGAGACSSTSSHLEAKTRRKRARDVESASYQPDEESNMGPPEEENRSTNGPGNIKLKRARTSEARLGNGNEGPDRKTKHRRLRSSTSTTAEQV